MRVMHDLLEGWGEEVARLMAERSLSITQLASICDVHPSTILRITRGQLNPNDELKWKIAGALSQRMDVLWAWPKVIPPAPAKAAS